MKLPENKAKDFDITPRIFFVYGESMSGKTYFARQFPNPILLNTDGNANKVDTPSVNIKDFKEFVDVLDELEKGKHTFETVIIDLVDDIDMMASNYVVKQAGKENLSEIPYGQGYSTYNTLIKNLMMKISKMPMNIIFISHKMEVTENNSTISKPTLPTKTLNATLGRCDLMIHTKKFGNKYMKICESKRDNYKLNDIKNEKIKDLLKDVTYLFEKENKVNSNLNELNIPTIPKL